VRFASSRTTARCSLKPILSVGNCLVSCAQHLADAPVHCFQVASKVGPFLWRRRFDVGNFERVVLIHFRLLAELHVGSLRRLQRCCLRALRCLHTLIIPSFSCFLTPGAEQIGRTNGGSAEGVGLGGRLASIGIPRHGRALAYSARLLRCRRASSLPSEPGWRSSRMPGLSHGGKFFPGLAV
jgi:hypothetical protein